MESGAEPTPPHTYRLPTGSVITVLGRPERTEPRYWDAAEHEPRADAWGWNCGCKAEPEGPGLFLVTGCSPHDKALAARAERAAKRHPSP
ncbi:MAG: hypothetical protein ACLPYS_19705 [Vulcanimicrobiaceae bacterium]